MLWQICVSPHSSGIHFQALSTFFLFCNVTNLSLLLSAMSVIDSRAYYSRFQSSQGQIILGWPQSLKSYQVLRLTLTKSYVWILPNLTSCKFGVLGPDFRDRTCQILLTRDVNDSFDMTCHLLLTGDVNNSCRSCFYPRAFSHGGKLENGGRFKLY